MNREFLINIIFLISINLLIKPFYIFGIDRTVQNTVGAEDYGIYFALFNFTYLLQIINDFGIQNYNNRKISQNNELLSSYFPNILVLKILLGFAYLATVLLVSWFFGYDFEWYHLIFFIAINQILISLQFYLRSNISGLGMYRADSLISAVDKAIMILICGFLLWFYEHAGSFTIEWFVYAQTVSLSMAAFLAFLVVRKKIPRIKLNYDPAFLKKVLTESYPYALVIFLMMVYTRIDAVMLERMLPDGKTEAGIYASAYRLLDASNMVGFLFAGLLLPMFAKILKAKESVNSLLKMSFQLIWAIALSLTIITYFFRQEIVELLYVESTEYWGEVLGYLMFSFIAVSGGYIFGTLLTANGSLMKMNAVFLIGVIINIVLNFIMIPEYKALGATWTTLITQFFVLIGQIWLCYQILSIRLNWNILLRIVGFILVLTGGVYSIYMHLELDWKLNFFLCTMFSIILAFVFQLISIKAFKELAPLGNN